MIYFCLSGDGAMYNLGEHENWESADNQAEYDYLNPVWVFDANQAGEWASFFTRVLNTKDKKDYSIDSNGYYMGDNLTPEQEIHNLNLDNQI